MDEDVILPDDYQATPSEESEVSNNSTDAETLEDTAEDTTEAEQSTEEAQEQTEAAKEEARKLKIKFNHQEMELGEDEAVPLIQKGMNYDKLQEQLNSLKSDPRLSFVEELARDNNMTVEQYLNAVKEQREQARLNELIQSNIPEEYAREILENRKFREELKAREEATQQESKRNADFQDFLSSYPNIKAEDIAPEVWQLNQQGVPLKYAYMQHENAKLQNELKVLKQNNENKKKAPLGSVTNYGSKESVESDPFLMGFDSI
jgi:hypothetical protein